MVLSFLKINDKMVCITRAKFILSHKNSLENKDKFNICLLHTNLKICFNAPLLLYFQYGRNYVQMKAMHPI